MEVVQVVNRASPVVDPPKRNRPREQSSEAVRNFQSQASLPWTTSAVRRGSLCVRRTLRVLLGIDNEQLILYSVVRSQHLVADGGGAAGRSAATGQTAVAVAKLKKRKPESPARGSVVTGDMVS